MGKWIIVSALVGLCAACTLPEDPDGLSQLERDIYNSARVLGVDVTPDIVKNAEPGALVRANAILYSADGLGESSASNKRRKLEFIFGV